MPLSFFRFLADLEQSTGQIPDAWSIILKFSPNDNLSSKETENRTSKGTVFA